MAVVDGDLAVDVAADSFEAADPGREFLIAVADAAEAGEDAFDLRAVAEHLATFGGLQASEGVLAGLRDSLDSRAHPVLSKRCQKQQPAVGGGCVQRLSRVPLVAGDRRAGRQSLSRLGNQFTGDRHLAAIERFDTGRDESPPRIGDRVELVSVVHSAACVPFPSLRIRRVPADQQPFSVDRCGPLARWPQVITSLLPHRIEHEEKKPDVITRPKMEKTEPVDTAERAITAGWRIRRENCPG